MSGQKRSYEDDDGRTIADMSALSGSGPHWFGALPPKERNTQARPAGHEERLNRSERFYAVAGALRAALLIALVYIAGFGAVIWLLLQLWK